MKRRWVAACCILAACGGRAILDGDVSGSGGANGSTTNASNASATGNATTGNGSTGSGQSFTACNGPGQCTLSYRGCCASCSAPELEDVVAVAGDRLEAFRSSECPAPEPCDVCEACENGNLYAYCDSGTCRAADLRKEPVSECSSANDCVLRAGSGCCETCGAIDLSCGGLVAINKDKQAQLASLVCGEGVGCPSCAPSYPEGSIAQCITGRCAVSTVRP